MSSPHVQRIADAISAESEHLIATGEDGYPASVVLTGWVLVAEWAGDDGDVWVTEAHPADQSWWRSLGLIEAARQDLRAPNA